MSEDDRRPGSLQTEDVEPFLKELGAKFHDDEDLLRLAQEVLDEKPPGTLSPEEVEEAALTRHRAAALERAKVSQLTRCIR